MAVQLVRCVPTVARLRDSVRVQATAPCAYVFYSLPSLPINWHSLQVWSTDTLAPLYVIVPNGGTDAGDIFSLTFSPSLSTLYFGSQNTSLQWLDLSHPDQLPSAQPETRPPSKRDKFFESGARAGTHTPSYYAQRHARPLPLNLHVLAVADEPKTLHVPAGNVVDSAHYGYIYCMALLPSPHLTASDPVRADGAVELLTGSGDEDVKVRHSVAAVACLMFSGAAYSCGSARRTTARCCSTRSTPARVAAC